MTEVIKVGDKSFSLFISNEKIQEAITRLATEIKEDYHDKNPLFVCILNGAFMFAGELMQALNDEYEICFAQYSSYKGTKSTGLLQEVMPPQLSMKDRNVIIVEDLIDSGLTISHIIQLYKTRGAMEVKVACMLHKPMAEKVVNINPDYIGLAISPEFIVGHGLDYDGKGRCFKDIYKIIKINERIR